MFFWELLKCSQNGAVAQPYFIISVILFLFSLENLVKPELTQKKRWARNYKAFSCQQIPHIWPLMTECTLSDVNVVAQSCVTAEDCVFLVVPFCASDVWQEAQNTVAPGQHSCPCCVALCLVDVLTHSSILLPSCLAGTGPVWGTSFLFFCGSVFRYIHPSMSVAFIYIWWRGTVLEVASFSTVLFTQVFQGYNYEQTFVNDMHACQADGSPDASVLLSSLLAVFPVYIPLLQTIWRLS